MAAVMPEIIPPTTDPHHPGEPLSKWRSGDVFRAVMFGVLAVVYAVLLFPFFVGLAVLWAVGKLTEQGSAPVS
jgi:hypothetical protein